jgi:hypothetical protein
MGLTAERTLRSSGCWGAGGGSLLQLPLIRPRHEGIIAEHMLVDSDKVQLRNRDTVA